MIAGAGAAILGQGAEATVEDSRAMRQRVSDTIQLPYTNSPTHLNCSVREIKVLIVFEPLCFGQIFFPLQQLKNIVN